MMTRTVPLFAAFLAACLAAGEAFAQTPPPASDAKKVEAPPAAPKAATPGVEGKAPLGGPVQIKVSDTVNFRFGLMLQPQADWTERAAGGTSQNLMLRRARFIVGGQVAKDVFFFFQTENSRLGAGTPTGKTTGGFAVLDAVAEWRVAKEFNLWGGLIYVPSSREALKSSSSQFMMDTSTFAYTASTALGWSTGRDTGFLARGYFAKDRLEYRVGVFQGLRDAASRNAFRTVTRLQYNFLDTEVYNLPAYTSSNFGKKKILAVGAAYDAQKDYQGYTGDVFADLPTGFGSVVGTAAYHHLDGGTFVTSLKEQNDFSIDAGLFFKGVKLGPWLRYEQRDVKNDDKASDKRYQAGLNFYPYPGSPNNLNLKVGYTYIVPKDGVKLSQFTVQLQGYYF